MTVDLLTAILKCAAKYEEVANIDVDPWTRPHGGPSGITITITIENEEQRNEEFHE